MTRIFRTAAAPPTSMGVAVYAANDYDTAGAVDADGVWNGDPVPGLLVEMGSTEDPTELFRLDTDPAGELYAAVIRGNIQAVEGAKVVAETALPNKQPAALVAMRRYALLKVEETRIVGHRGRKVLAVFGEHGITTIEDDSATRIIYGIEESRTPVDARMPPIEVPKPNADFVSRIKSGLLGGKPGPRTGAPPAAAEPPRTESSLPKGRTAFPALGSAASAAAAGAAAGRRKPKGRGADA